MANKEILNEIKASITAMQEKKAAELQTVYQKQTEAQTQKEAADLAIKDATDRMDLKAYEKAKDASEKAQAAIDMYSGKYEQIRTQEYISEADSDKTIDVLLAHEEDLEDDFKKILAEHLAQLHKILADYRAEVDETETVIKTWVRDIHANYRNEYTTYADGTNRSPNPVPVHRSEYHGCRESIRLETYLRDNVGLYHA